MDLKLLNEMPPLVRFLVRHATIGLVIAVVFVGGLLWRDTGGLRTLAAASSSGTLAIVLLTIAVGLTFASVQMGFAVMLLGSSSHRDGGKRGMASVASIAVRTAGSKQGWW